MTQTYEVSPVDHWWSGTYSGRLDLYKKAVTLVSNSLTNENTRRVYVKALNQFFDFLKDERPLNRQTVREWRALLAETHSPAYINQRLSAVRKLIRTLDDDGLIDPTLAQQILRVKGVPMRGVRMGRWLSKDDANALLEAPDTHEPNELRGYRDRAILAVMLGAGLRRSEVASLRTSQVSTAEGRFALINIDGKGGRVRTIPIAPWVREAIDNWLWRAARVRDVAATSYSKVFRSVSPGGKLNGSIDPQTIHDIVTRYANEIGVEASPHDLRRTFASHAMQKGAKIEQIQHSLGHASIQTTERYLGIQQDFVDSPSDRLDYGGTYVEQDADSAESVSSNG